MRVSELLHRDVTTSDGTWLGRVADVRLTGHRDRDGITLRVDGLVLVHARWTRLFGYDHDNVRGPWPLSLLGQKAAQASHYVPWHQVADVTADQIRVDRRIRSHEDLRPRPDLRRVWPEES